MCIPTLEALRARGVPLAMVTNGDASHQRRKIDRHDLERFFDVIVVEGEMGVGKPEEVVYRYALSKLGVKAEEAWMVGDNLEWDVLAPQRLGLRGVWVDAPGQGLPKACSVRAAPHHPGVSRAARIAWVENSGVQHCDSTWILIGGTHQCATGSCCRCSSAR